MTNDKRNMVDQEIERIALLVIKRTRSGDAEFSDWRLVQRLADIARAGRPFDDVIQTFAGYLTEHTMGTVQEGGAKRGEASIKIAASRGELVERNGGDLPS